MQQHLNKLELLAPAGGTDQLHAAVRFGADAVYLATNKFGMRARATNFSLDELMLAVKYAHSHNVKVYVTANILMHERDIKELPVYFQTLAKIGVDAFIIGDMGAAAIAQRVAPDVALHVSTQASVANSEAIKAWKSLGASRIVLAREMSLEEIKALDTDIELECFVHGAMCMSISGRCLISSYLTGRSANKGFCTQPCRWGYSLMEEKRPGQEFSIEEDNYGTYIMNSKDMNMLEYLDDLDCVSSIKIEGRNKKSLYVATVVNAYRHVLDGEPASKWAPELDKVSHRPYSTGFFYGDAEQSPDYDGYEQQCVHVGDVLDDGLILCRNHFEEGETLEALIPGEDVREVKVQNLRLKNKFIPVANVAKELYEIDHQLPKGSLLRSKKFLRTSR